MFGARSAPYFFNLFTEGLTINGFTTRHMNHWTCSLVDSLGLHLQGGRPYSLFRVFFKIELDFSFYVSSFAIPETRVSLWPFISMEIQDAAPLLELEKDSPDIYNSTPYVIPSFLRNFFSNSYHHLDLQ